MTINDIFINILNISYSFAVIFFINSLFKFLPLFQNTSVKLKKNHYSRQSLVFIPYILLYNNNMMIEMYKRLIIIKN